MHPIERLRMVARVEGEDPALVAREAAAVLATCASDPASLVTCCRRLVDHQPTSGPMWWLAARVLAAPDPEAEAWRSADALTGDPTAAALAFHLPEEMRVTVLGWPDLAAEALRRRGDLPVLVVDAAGVGSGLAANLRRAGAVATLVGESGLGPAVVASGLVLLEALAVGPDGLLAVAGSRAAAAVARQARVAVWVVAGAGRVLPGRLWKALMARQGSGADPWDRDEELVPLELVDAVVGPAGPRPPSEAVAHADCPEVPELTRTWGAPGPAPSGPPSGDQTRPG